MEPITSIESHLAEAGVLVDSLRDDVQLIGSLVEHAPEAMFETPAADTTIEYRGGLPVDTSAVWTPPNLGEVDMGEALMALDKMEVPEFMRGVSKETPKAMVAMMIWKGLIDEMKLNCLNIFADWRACHSHAYMSEQDGTVEIRPNVRVARAFKVFVKPLPRRMNKNGTAFTVIPLMEVVGKVPA